MKTFLCCLALGALPALGQEPQPLPDVALYCTFEHPPPPVVLDSLKEEVSSILSPMGERFEWRSLNAVQRGEASVEVAVVTFKGSCDLGAPITRDFQARALLGRTHITDGVILPFSDVDCDGIRAFVDRALSPLQASDREAAFGRAVGRVVAHELYHIFANTTHHESAGVARSAFSVQELTADTFRLAEAAIRPESARAPAPNGRSLFAESGCVTCHGFRGEGTRHAPAIHTSGRSLNVLSLGARLGNRASEMYRRARGRKLSWGPFAEAEIRSLVGFLNRSSD